MFRSKMRKIVLLANGLTAIFWTVFSGCASIGTPGGGLYDETPPVLRNSDPSDGATNVKKRKITMHFDENIKLDNALEKLTVSPPQSKSPIIMSNAKTLTIELLDSLKPLTTYSIDLGTAVLDNNEGNAMEGLSLLFSTGPEIDSLQLSGYLLNAADLEPITGAYVGIYREEGNSLGDSIFLRRPMERAGKTDAYGAFHILGCAPGRYRLFALVDGNANFLYDMTTEDIAVCDSLVSPSSDSTQIVLLAYNEGHVTRYLEDCARPDSNRITVRFAARMDSLPQIDFLYPTGLSDNLQDLLIAEPNPTCDTLVYWLKDSALYNADTLLLSLTYQFTDTTGFDILRTDTMELVRPARKAKPADRDDKSDKRLFGRKKKPKKDAQQNDSVVVPEVTYMTLTQISGQHLGIGAKPKFEVSAPLATFDPSGMHLQWLKDDTLWVDMPHTWVPDTVLPRHYTLLASPHYTPGVTYRLTVDSAAMHDVYGHPVNYTKLSFKEKTNEEYAHLLFNIEGIEGPAFIELVDSRDRPLQTAPVKDGKAKFVHVNPGSYFARLVVDRNNNGRFDTGSLFEHVAPEQVYYFGAQLVLRSNWTIQQTWNPTLTPLLQQKPEEVKQNKPKQKREKKSRNEEYLRSHRVR